MKADEISFEVKKDLLIVIFGESYMKTHKRERMAYVCSSRMRELSGLLIQYKLIVNNRDICFKDLLHPKNFYNVIHASRIMGGYDHEKKNSEHLALLCI